MFEELDLASYDSIKEFVSRIKEKENQVNILINNAGKISGNKF